MAYTGLGIHTPKQPSLSTPMEEGSRLAWGYYLWRGARTIRSVSGAWEKSVHGEQSNDWTADDEDGDLWLRLPALAAVHPKLQLCNSSNTLHWFVGIVGPTDHKTYKFKEEIRTPVTGNLQALSMSASSENLSIKVSRQASGPEWFAIGLILRGTPASKASSVGPVPGSSRSRGKMECPHGNEFSFAFSLYPEHSLDTRRHVGPDVVRQAGRGVVITQHDIFLDGTGMSICVGKGDGVLTSTFATKKTRREIRTNTIAVTDALQASSGNLGSIRRLIPSGFIAVFRFSVVASRSKRRAA
ncbi:hypothetical protein EV421DRAFT_1738037 [Armillaria borealis]|uniref:Uncharacterized protein n=1 Tax=Armillaria borealis TaxID=47425 RepID=A0AA39JBW4_9AGAR|nr:hypothetical protein EV421DRAFT_1738037 [Armillaria borealis]